MNWRIICVVRRDGLIEWCGFKELAIDRLSFLYVNLYQSRLGICFHLRLLGFFRGSHTHVETNAFTASMGSTYCREPHTLRSPWALPVSELEESPLSVLNCRI